MSSSRPTDPATAGPNNFRCPYCKASHFTTARGLNVHMSQSTVSGCAQRHKERFDNRDSEDPEDILENNQPNNNEGYLRDSPSAEDGNNDLHDGPHGEASMDVDMDEGPGEHLRQGVHVDEFYPPAGVVKGVGRSRFENILKREREDGVGFYGTFDNKGDWEMAKWLFRHVGQNATDEFLKLEVVSRCMLCCETAGLTETIL